MSSRLNIPKGRSYQRFLAVSKTRIQLKYLPKSFEVSKLTRLLSSSLKWILPQRMQVQTVNNWSQVISIRAKTTKYHCNCEDLANGFHSPFCFVVFSRENLIIWVRWREILQLFNNFAVLPLFPVVCNDKKKFDKKSKYLISVEIIITVEKLVAEQRYALLWSVINPGDGTETKSFPYLGQRVSRLTCSSRYCKCRTN